MCIVYLVEQSIIQPQQTMLSLHPIFDIIIVSKVSLFLRVFLTLCLDYHTWCRVKQTFTEM